MRDARYWRTSGAALDMFRWQDAQRGARRGPGGTCTCLGQVAGL